VFAVDFLQMQQGAIADATLCCSWHQAASFIVLALTAGVAILPQ
jgi:hypothetical protein